MATYKSLFVGNGGAGSCSSHRSHPIAVTSMFFLPHWCLFNKNTECTIIYIAWAFSVSLLIWRDLIQNETTVSLFTRNVMSKNVNVRVTCMAFVGIRGVGKMWFCTAGLCDFLLRVSMPSWQQKCSPPGKKKRKEKMTSKTLKKVKWRQIRRIRCEGKAEWIPRSKSFY